MKAAVYTEYGSPEVVSIQTVAKPVPKKNEVLIRIHATSVNSGDMRARALDMPTGFGLIGRLVFGIFAPRKHVLGVELAGVIEAVGQNVQKFKVDDAVFAACEGFGAHAEYVVLSEDGPMALKPPMLSFKEAAVLSFGGVTALQFLRDKAGINAGDHVLVNGASGAVGVAAIQIAKHFGATVTGVSSSENHDLIKALGADNMIDYRRQDFTKSGETYDIIIDTVGTAPWKRSKPALNKTGRLALVQGSLGDMLRAGFVSRKSGKKLLPGVAIGKAADLNFLAKLVRQGAYKPVIDRSFSFPQIVDAHRYVDTGRKRGSVAISVIAA